MKVTNSNITKPYIKLIADLVKQKIQKIIFSNLNYTILTYIKLFDNNYMLR